MGTLPKKYNVLEVVSGNCSSKITHLVPSFYATNDLIHLHFLHISTIRSISYYYVGCYSATLN